MSGRGGMGGGYGAYGEEDDDYPVVGLDLLTPAEYEADERRLAAYRAEDAQRAAAAAAASTQFMSAGGVGEDPDRLTAPLPPYGGPAPVPAQPAPPVHAATGGFDYGDPGGAPPTAEDAAMLNAAWQQYDEGRGGPAPAGAPAAVPAVPAVGGPRPAATPEQVARAHARYLEATQPALDQAAAHAAAQAEAQRETEAGTQHRFEPGAGAPPPGVSPVLPFDFGDPGGPPPTAEDAARMEAALREYDRAQAQRRAAEHRRATWRDSSIGASEHWPGGPPAAASADPESRPWAPAAPPTVREGTEAKAPWEQMGEEADPEWLRRAVHAGEADDPLSGYQRAASRLWEPVARGAARADAALGAGEAALGLAGVPFSAPGALAAELLKDGGMAEEGAELLGAFDGTFGAADIGAAEVTAGEAFWINVWRHQTRADHLVERGKLSADQRPSAAASELLTTLVHELLHRAGADEATAIRETNEMLASRPEAANRLTQMLENLFSALERDGDWRVDVDDLRTSFNTYVDSRLKMAALGQSVVDASTLTFDSD